MKQENKEYLLNKHLKLFSNYRFDYNLNNEKIFTIQDGWLNLIDLLCTELSSLPEPIYIWHLQSKFGCLRINTSMPTINSTKILNKYEDLSAKTCEHCGQSSSIRNLNGYVVTLCDACNVAERKRRGIR